MVRITFSPKPTQVEKPKTRKKVGKQQQKHIKRKREKLYLVNCTTRESDKKSNTAKVSAVPSVLNSNPSSKASTVFCGSGNFIKFPGDFQMSMGVEWQISDAYPGLRTTLQAIEVTQVEASLSMRIQQQKKSIFN